MNIKLNEQERMAIDFFLGEHWAAFCKIAEQYMDLEEIEKLGEKLSKN